jgi:hypothetical protein
MIEEPDILSPQGRRRRDEIGRLAREAARRRRHQRRIMPVIALSGLVLVVAVETGRLLRFSPGPPPPIARVETNIAPTPAPRSPTDSKLTISLIETEAGISDRLSSAPKPADWTKAGDDELLQSLADAGHPSGLLYTNGQAILLAHSR